jgi:prevent-host-death family protein
MENTKVPLNLAINSSYNTEAMDFSIVEAKNRLPELIRAVEEGERVVITRHGKPVAQLLPPPPERRPVRLGAMKGRIQLLPGWDAPIDPERFLDGGL